MAQVARARALLRQDERGRRAGGRERRAFGDAPAAGLAEHDLRALAQARRFRQQRVGGEEARRHAELLARRAWIAGSAALSAIEKTPATATAATRPASREASHHERAHLVRRRRRARSRCRGRASAGWRISVVAVGGRRDRSVTTDRPAALAVAPAGERQRCASQPQSASAASISRSTGSPASSAAMTAFAAAGLATRQPGGGSSSARPSRTSPAVVIGGDAAERCGDPARQVVGAVMAAEQRHDDAAVLGDGDDRRLGALVGQERAPGCGSGCRRRKTPMIGSPAANRPRRCARDIVEAHGRLGDARRIAVQRRIGQRGDEALRERQRRSVPRTTTAVMAQRSPAMARGSSRNRARCRRGHRAARQMRWVARVARSTRQAPSSRSASAVSRRRTAAEMAADLDDRGGLGVGEARAQRVVRQRRRQHRQRRRCGAASGSAGDAGAGHERGDAGHDLHRAAVGQARVEIHEGAVEERDRPRRARRRRGRRATCATISSRGAVIDLRLREAGRRRAACGWRSPADRRADAAPRCCAREAVAAVRRRIGDDGCGAQEAQRLQRQQLRIAGADAEAVDGARSSASPRPAASPASAAASRCRGRSARRG